MPFMLSPWLLATALVLICAAADRVIGWGVWGRTKPVVVTAIALALVAYAMRLPLWAIVTFPIAFLAWRTPPWGWFGGSINPEPSHIAGTFARHLLALAFLIPGYFAHYSPFETAAYMIIFAFLASALAIANYYDEAHANQTVETLRGVMLGTTLALAFIFPVVMRTI